MEDITEGVNKINIAEAQKKNNRIQVSNTKKPLFFYVNLSKVLAFHIRSCLFIEPYVNWAFLIPGVLCFLEIHATARGGRAFSTWHG